MNNYHTRQAHHDKAHHLQTAVNATPKPLHVLLIAIPRTLLFLRDSVQA